MKLPDSPRAFITGAGSGLGRALALELAPRGARLLLGDIHLEGAEQTAELVRAKGGQAVTLACDVSKPGDWEAAARAADEAWGGLDLLVNNAGVAVAGEVGAVPLTDWQWILGVNLWGVIHGCHVFVPRFRGQGRGWILNVASAAGLISLPMMAPYNATKAAVVALSETLHAELAPHGVSVSVLCPTFFKTNIVNALRAPEDQPRKLAQAFVDRSTVSAEQVARQALHGLERGRLHVVPQWDGRLAWFLKRFSPRGFSWLMGRQLHAKWAQKL